MSKIVLISCRKGSYLPYSTNEIELLSERLSPDNITPAPPRIIENSGILIGIVNPADVLPIKNSSVCMGGLFSHQEDWWIPGADVPDGSYALFRSNVSNIELLTDIVGSRTIWYIHTDTLFIASTSQRAIIFFLQDLQLNHAVHPWILSSGTLGPGLSWDTRIKCLEGNARLRLDRKSWKMRITRNPVEFIPQKLPAKIHKHRLQEALEETFSHLHLDFGKWILPLSGGVDSRSILQMLPERKGLKAITWGTQSALNDKHSDACVAKLLADHFNIAHKYFELDGKNESFEEIFSRFLMAGEGRVDNISGYLDGFEIWKQLYESSYQGIIRGDEAFGCHAVRKPWEVHRNMSLRLLSDFNNLDYPLKRLIDYNQQRPISLEKRQDESLEEWRDRLNSIYEIPAVFAALNDLKLPYVEIINPLLSRRIIEQVRQLPDELRTGKKLFSEIVSTNSPGIRYAKRPAIPTKNNILNDPDVLATLSNDLESPHAKNIFSPELLEHVLTGLKVKAQPHKTAVITSKLQKLANIATRKIGLHKPTQTIELNLLAFRLCIIIRMAEILENDALFLEKNSTAITRHAINT